MIQYYDVMLKLVKEKTDITSDKSHYLFELMYIFLLSEDNVRKTYEKCLLRYLVGLLRRIGVRINTKFSILKIISVLCKYNEFLVNLKENRMMPSLMKIIITLFKNYLSNRYYSEENIESALNVIYETENQEKENSDKDDDPNNDKTSKI